MSSNVQLTLFHIKKREVKISFKSLKCLVHKYELNVALITVLWKKGSRLYCSSKTLTIRELKQLVVCSKHSTKVI